MKKLIVALIALLVMPSISLAAKGGKSQPAPYDAEAVDNDIIKELCKLYDLVNADLPVLCFNCGNGVIEPSEQCDDQNDIQGDGCNNCLYEECGNGILDIREECDDGNLDNGDGCDANCTIENAVCTPGESKSCDVTSQYGTCSGIMTCDETGWSVCSAKTPSAEICNGIDDNCNGAIDEDCLCTPGESISCDVANAYGTCSGIMTCDETGWSVCSAKTPSAEICNGVDDNCDGTIDEGC